MRNASIFAGIGACVLLTFPSCQTTDNAFSGDYEEAAMLSTYVTGEDEIPAWLQDDPSNGPGIDAPATTAMLPAPDEPVADNGGSASTRQNNPDVAVNDDVVVENTPIPAPDAALDPLSGAPVTQAVATVKPKTPTPSKPKTSTGKKTGSASTKNKITKPTMIVYKVRPGDNLSDIAKRSNTTVAQIRKDSGIKGDLIKPGQTIKVRYTPKGYVAPKSTKTTKGAKNTKNGKTTKSSGSYTVKSGDTISAIAKRNGVTTSAILKANGMTAADATKIRPGKTLSIPKK